MKDIFKMVEDIMIVSDARKIVEDYNKEDNKEDKLGLEDFLFEVLNEFEDEECREIIRGFRTRLEVDEELKNKILAESEKN